MIRVVFALLALFAFTLPGDAQFADQQNYVVGAGTANAQTASYPNATTIADLLGVALRIQATATNTGAATLTVNSFSAYNIEKTSPSGLVPLVGGEIQNGVMYSVMWDGFQFEVINAVNNSGIPQGCQLNGLKIVSDGTTPNSIMDISFTSATLIVPATNSGIRLGAGSGSLLNVNITTTGAGGIDAGSATANGFLNFYVIYNGTTVAGLATNASNASPTLPAGYIYSCFAGSAKVNASSNFYGFRQIGNEARYVNGGNLLTSLPVIVNGTAGSTSCATGSPSYSAEVVQGNSGAAPLWFPASAGVIDILVNTEFNSSGGQVLLAPNNAYAGFASSTNNTNPPYASLTASGTFLVSFVPESTSIYYCSTGAGGALHAVGWKVGGLAAN